MSLNFIAEPLVSVVVPMYNSENTIRNTIESVLNQRYKNFELILIDDGSNDKTNYICETFLNKDERIKYIFQENKGVSTARNTGISEARGEYLIFLDADDELENDIIHLAVNKMKSSDLCIWGADENHQGITMHSDTIFIKSITKNKFIASSIFNSNSAQYNLGKFFKAVWGKMFITNVIKGYGIKFPADCYMGEDGIFLCEYLIHINRISYIELNGYLYNVSNTSAVQRYKKDLAKQSSIQLHYYMDLIKKYNLENIPDCKIALENLKWNLLEWVIINSSKGCCQKEVGYTEIFNDAILYYKIEAELYRSSHLRADELERKFRLVYRYKEIRNPFIICFLLLLSVIKSKLNNQITHMIKKVFE